MQSTWEGAHSAALRELVDKGVTFSEIARLLNERFGTAYTRNATIGRGTAHGALAAGAAGFRWGVSGAETRRYQARQQKVRPHPASSPAKPSTQQRAAVLQLRCVAITPRHLALVDLEPSDCRYPYGGEAEGEPITERQRKAVLRLNRIERELGVDGVILAHEVLVLGVTMEQVGLRRGLRGQRWKDYFARRFLECLDRLALIYGFASARGAGPAAFCLKLFAWIFF